MAGAGWKDFVPGSVLTAADVQDYLQDQSVMVFASGAARTSALASPTEGMVSYLSDTNIMQMYTGSSWLTIADDNGLPIANGGTGATTVEAARESLRVGLVPISPTSVAKAGGSSTATANTLGQVTFSECTSLSLNGVFTSNFASYRVVMSYAYAGTGTDFNFRLRASDTDATTAYYLGGSYRDSNNAGGTLATSNGTGFNLGAVQANTDWLASSFDIYSPQETRPTRYTNITVGSNGSPVAQFSSAGVHNIASSYDGLTLYPTAATTITGKIQVFGYND